MKTRLLIISGIIGIIGFYAVPQAFALSCGIPLFTESYERHDLLLHGKLVEKEILFPDSVYSKHTSLTFDTIKVYKGEFSKTFTIKADLSWDDFYREGEEYVLFADKDGSGYLRELCVPNYLASSSIIKFLDDPSKDSEIYFLYNLLSESELEDIDKKMTAYSDLNRAEIVNGTRTLDSYVVGAGSYGMTWGGALQIMIILLFVVGIILAAKFIIKRKRK